MQNSSPHTYIPLNKIKVKKNHNEQDKNDKFYAQSDIFESLNAIVNIPSLFPLAEIDDLNWYISFINIMEKNILQAYSTMILTKTLHISKVFEYLKSLWYINSSAINYICISWQRFSNYHPI